MKRIKKINHLGKEIIYTDYSGLNEVKLIETILDLEKTIFEENKPFLHILNLSNTLLTMKVLLAINRHARLTKHLLLKSAVIGITGINNTIIEGISTIFGREIKPFNNLEDAKNWIVV